MKECVLTREELQICFRLHGNTDANVLCDMIRPLGTFLAEFEHDPEEKWSRFGLALLRESLHSNCWKQPALEQSAGVFLAKKLIGDPVRMYAAFHIWNDCLLAREPRERAKTCECFMDKMIRFTQMFQERSPHRFDPYTDKPECLHIYSRVFGSVSVEETKLDFWYPDNKRSAECVAAYASLYPIITCYLNRLDDWGLHLRKCKICGRLFLAESLRYGLCSDKCRKAQALQNKREFDERTMDNNYGLVYKNECQHWRNIINKTKKNLSLPANHIVGYTLDDIIIAYENQNKGIGSMLLRELEQRVKEKGASCVELRAVNDDMHERYYGKAGYQNAKNFILKVKWFE